MNDDLKELLKWISHVDSKAMVTTDGWAKGFLLSVDIDLEDWDHIVELAKKLST